MKVGLLDRGVWGRISDLLGDLSALCSYEDALAEAVYEELGYLVTQKEGLLGSPGGCPCLPSWDLYTLPYGKEVTRGNLLYDAGSSTRCSVTTWRDGVVWEVGQRFKR